MAVYTKVEPETVAALLARYDRGVLVRLDGVAAGSVNTNYSVATDRERLFLRIYEEQEWDGAVRDITTLAALVARGVPTPPPLQAKGGEHVLRVSGKPAALFPWVDGAIVCQARVTPSHLIAVGGALARLHLASSGLADARGEGRFQLGSLLERVGLIAEGGGELAAQAPRLRSSLIDADRGRDRTLPRGLLHADLFRDNVLWKRGPSGAAELGALLDFESAHDGVFVYDLATVLLSWCFGDGFDPTLVQALVAGYERERPLGVAERAAIYDEALFAALRFTVTRITDYAMRADAAALRGDRSPRVLKDWRRFAAREAELRSLGRAGFAELSR